MKTALIIIVVLFSSAMLYLFILGMNSKNKTIPGLIDGHLLKCPDTPNCISTEIKDHAGHYTAPITLPKNTDSSKSMLVLKNILKNMGGSIQVENSDYIAATFTSSIFGFVDDFEIRIDRNKNIIHFRSASRVGRSDMEVNKKRLALVKKLYKNKITENTK